DFEDAGVAIEFDQASMRARDVGERVTGAGHFDAFSCSRGGPNKFGDLLLTSGVLDARWAAGAGRAPVAPALSGSSRRGGLSRRRAPASAPPGRLHRDQRADGRPSGPPGSS